jgi:glycosyltransferase involved in cell wall biosynthesis
MSARYAVSSPWLSVIMPSYRGEQWIGAALASVAAETAQDVEVIVIDSSPTSATVDIARRFSDRLRLRIFERADLPMWHAKTNFGVEVAEASHICWLHQDDLWLPGRAVAVRSWIETSPKAALHLAPTAIIDQRSKTLGIWRCPLPVDRELSAALVIERLLIQNFISTPAPVIRKDCYLACGGLDETLWYTADWDMWLKVVTTGPVHYHNGITTGFRVHADSLSMSGRRDIANFTHQMQIVLERHLTRVSGAPKSVERAARVSIAVNTALASFSISNPGSVVRAGLEILLLGPAGIRRYLRDSRIVERVMPRLLAKFGGAF